MNIEISQLHTLVAIVKTGSFSNGAEELGVTQSAISQSVKHLEDKLGVRIFKRQGKKVTLTLEGEKLYVTAKKMITRLEDTIKEIQYDKNEMSGVIRFGTLMGIGKSWVGDNLMEFAKLNSEVSLIIELKDPKHISEEFEKFHLDAVILPESTLPTSGDKIHFFDEFVTLVFPKDNNFDFDFNATKKLTIDNLSKLPLIVFEEEDVIFTNWCRKLFGKLPTKINRRLVVNSHGKMLQAVGQGLGVAVLPTHVLKRSYYRNYVKTLGKEYEVFNNSFYFVIHKESYDLKRMTTLKNMILENSEKLSD